MNSILIAVVLVAIISVICGLGLAIASIIMAVPVDKKAKDIEEILPGANCGACGFSGCSGYAKALSDGEAPPNLCAPGGAEVAQKVSSYLGVDSGSITPKVAMVHCQGNLDNTKENMIYQGIDSCAAASKFYGGALDCSYACLGFGDCYNACEFNAITVCNGLAFVNPANCKACGKCIEACPKNLISMIEIKPQAVVKCSNCDKGVITNKECKVGCIGCGKCMKACEFDAIKVKNFLASVNADKCTACGKCVGVCPKNCIELLYK